jgi:hypothetical protein
MVKTIYIPTLIQYQKYTAPYFEAIQYTGSEDIMKALHGFITGLIKNNIMHVQVYRDFMNENKDPDAKHYKALNIEADDDDLTVIQKLCNFVKTEDDFKIVSELFGLEYKDIEVCASYSIVKIEIV